MHDLAQVPRELQHLLLCWSGLRPVRGWVLETQPPPGGFQLAS